MSRFLKPWSLEELRDRMLLHEQGDARQALFARAVLRLLHGWQRFMDVGRRSMQRFTPAGKTALWLYIASLFFVVNTRTTMNFQVFALLLSLLGLGFFAALLLAPPQGLVTARRTLPRHATAGTPLEYDIVLINSSEKVQQSLGVVESLMPEHVIQTREERTAQRRLVLREADAAPLRIRLAWKRLLQGSEGSRAAQGLEAAVPTIPPGGKVRVRISTTPMRRGVLRFNESALTAPDPLGLFRSFSPLPAGESLLVLPARFEVPRLQLGKGRRHQPGGLRMASRVGEDGEFASLREYRRGDPMRHIHWRSWARHGKPIVKQFQQEYFARHGLVLDTFPAPMRTPTPQDAVCFEAAVSVAASFAAAPMEQDTLLDLLFVAGKAHCVTAGRGLGSVGQMLEILAGVQPNVPLTGEDTDDFSMLSRLVLSHAPLMSGCVCIFLGYDEQRRDLVAALRRHGVEPWVLVLPCGGGRKEEALEDDPAVHLLDPRNLEEELAAL